ncbi:MAG: hypothetical protein WD072_04075 [Pirellulales bacterium]
MSFRVRPVLRNNVRATASRDNVARTKKTDRPLLAALDSIDALRLKRLLLVGSTAVPMTSMWS